MPYINKHRRDILAMEATAQNSGELNYQITQLIIEYLHTNGKSYTTINDVIGALAAANLEFYRRVAAPYEDEKIKENGDVYTD